MEPLTDQQLQAAFAAMAWSGWTFEAAMAAPIRSRVLKARAAAMRAAEYRRTHTRTVRLVRRFNPATGAWRTQRVAGPYDDRQTAFDA